MASAKLTLIGMYQWDNTLFSEMVMPEGIDKDLLIQALIMRGGEFEVLYPQPEFMKTSIKIWSTKWFRTFKEWLRGTKQTWNPIYNYDRFEEVRDNNEKSYGSKTSADYTDSRRVDLDDTRVADLKEQRTADLKDKRTADLQDKRTADLTDKRTADLNEKTLLDNADTTTQLDNMTTEHQVAAYDSSSYQPSSKDIVNNGESKVEHTGSVNNATTGTDTTEHTGSDTTDHTGTDTTEHTGTDTTEHTGTDTMKHTGTESTKRKGNLSDTEGNEQNLGIHEAHMYGNIGITTSATMLKEFYSISAWNLYEHISDVFVSELLVPVY